MDERLEIENGKYTIINNNGIVRVLRYGEEWNYDVDKFTLCLIQTIEQQQDKNIRLQVSVTELERENSIIRLQIKRLKAYVDKIQEKDAEIDELKESIKSYEIHVDFLDVEIDGYQKEIERLKEENKKHPLTQAFDSLKKYQ